MFSLAPFGINGLFPQVPQEQEPCSSLASLDPRSCQKGRQRKRDDLGIALWLHTGAPWADLAPCSCPARRGPGPGRLSAARLDRRRCLLKCAVKRLSRFPYFHVDVFFLSFSPSSAACGGRGMGTREFPFSLTFSNMAFPFGFISQRNY